MAISVSSIVAHNTEPAFHVVKFAARRHGRMVHLQAVVFEDGGPIAIMSPYETGISSARFEQDLRFAIALDIQSRPGANIAKFPVYPKG